MGIGEGKGPLLLVMAATACWSDQQTDYELKLFLKGVWVILRAFLGEHTLA